VTKTTAPWTSRKLAQRIARLADDKQAAKIVVLDVAQALQVTDYFVVCEGQNRRHVTAIAESVAKELKQEGLHRMGGTPMGDENWVLLDFGPVVLHVFGPTARTFYDLENLWGDCPRLRWRKPAPRKRAPAPDEAAPADPEDSG
jgi:ribosome-associated protein